MSDKTPAAGAGTSIVTLSVSSSTSGSSTATASPGFLNHLPMVASVTDSPSVGTRISAMVFSFFVMAGLVDPAIHVFVRHVRRRCPAGAGHDAKQLSQRVLQKRLELHLMLRHQAG